MSRTLSVSDESSFAFRFGLPTYEVMVKDLRTTAVHLRMHKYPTLNGVPWGLSNPQPFFPPLEKLFKTETVAGLSEYGIKLSDEIDSVLSESQIRTTRGKTVDIHRKTTMILSPFKWMRGDYGTLGLPKPEEVATEMQEKLQSPNTAGYVGALTSVLLSESECIHFPKVYGVYTGLANAHTVDISDDYEDICERRWFTENIGKTFELKMRQPEGHAAEFTHTRGARPGVVLGDTMTLEDIQDIDADHVSNPSTRSRSDSHADSDTEYHDERSSVDSEDDEFDIRSCDCSSEDSEDDDEGDEEESFVWATFKNVPVVTTVMEKCDGTFYDLIETHTEPEKHAAWVAQIVFALSFAQRNYGFTHNDLHGNNVMYVKTDQEYLHYKHNGICYKVPTHGYIMKIIDFDRAIVSVRLVGMKDPRQFVSSQFHIEDEAAGQYNIEPFFTQTQPHIPPNPSFDLCRFATSMFWDMFPEGPDHGYTHPLFSVFKQWMTQSDGTSVCFREKRDRHDRYHGFDLYKAIARYCKDSAVPRRELSKLSVYQVSSVPVGTPCLFLES